MKVGAVIVAAGMSSRMKNFKPMLPLGDVTIIKREIITLKQAGVSPIIIVTGNQREALEEHLRDEQVECIYNPYYETTEMYTSAMLGLEAVKDRCDYTFFLPVDVPLFTTFSLKKMMECIQGQVILRPTYKGKYGHPILIQTQVIEEIGCYQGDRGLKGAIEQLVGRKEDVPVTDRGITIDADTPTDYKKIVSYDKNKASLEEVACVVDIALEKQTKSVNRTLVTLLQMIDELGSLQLACEAIPISYSKAWKLLKSAEVDLGMKLLYRQVGGANGGGSVLTYEAREFVTKFFSFEAEIKAYTDQLFEAYFIS